VLPGVSDGIRTRGHLDHNQVLYLLSYAHHCGADIGRGATECIGRAAPAGNQAQASGASEPPCCAARPFAVSESGPGRSTNTAAR
jgi:hypothetical protein